MKYYNLSFSLKSYGIRLIFYNKRNQSLGRQRRKSQTHRSNRTNHTNLNQKCIFKWETKCSRAQQHTIETDRINDILFAFEWSVLFGLLEEEKATTTATRTKKKVMTTTIFHTRNLNQRKYIYLIFTFLSNVSSNSIQPSLSPLPPSIHYFVL